MNFKDLKGMTLVKAYVDPHPNSYDTPAESIVLETADRSFRLHHEQDCCESVYLESIVGDLADIVGEPLLIAEEVTHENTNPPGCNAATADDSYTWTFYKLATRKGYVDIRWFGTSNGYYSESVDFDEITKEKA